MTSLKLTIAKKLEYYRKVRQMSREYIAFELNISTSAYGKYERGETELSLVRMVEIAAVLEIDPIEFTKDCLLSSGIYSNKRGSENSAVSSSQKDLEVIAAQKRIENLSLMVDQIKDHLESLRPLNRNHKKN
jgi:transcriptional regulator with XRE-family HTH domain